jgi:hypothetical protein
LQEYETAVDCVKAVFPSSAIQANRTDKYPVHVRVVASHNGKQIEIWSGSQKDLFRKYASKRAKAIQTMQANLQDFKEEYFGDSE